MTRTFVVVVLVAGFVLAGNVAVADPGDVDSGFGVAGSVLFDSGGIDQAYAATVEWELLSHPPGVFMTLSSSLTDRCRSDRSGTQSAL